MGERVAWSREDIIVAYALYCITPLNDIRPSNKLIQQVACGFSHSVSSLVMRMKNFAAIDPNSKARALSSSWLISWNKKRKEKHNPDGISGRLQE